VTRKKITLPDLRFNDENMNRLVEHIRKLTEEVNDHTQILEGGTEGQVLTKQSDRDYDASFSDP
jgi:hypothetical protein